VRRRALLALAGAGLTGGSVWVATGGLASDDRLPVTVTTMDARGSEAGSFAVPAAGAVTVVDLFATWCSPCTEQMDALAPVHEAYADADDVRFVSVTNERLGETLTRDDVRAWWRENHGNWTLGLDPESRLLSALGASGLPFVAVAAPDGTVTWSESGVAGAATLRERIEAARQR
jgi:thiol-disulfide isomerase/thioredoxin